MPDPVQDTVSDSVAAHDEEPDVEAHGDPVQDTVSDSVQDTVNAADDEPDVEAHGGIGSTVEDTVNDVVN